MNIFAEKKYQQFLLKRNLLFKIINISERQQFENIFCKIGFKKNKKNKCFL